MGLPRSPSLRRRHIRPGGNQASEVPPPLRNEVPPRSAMMKDQQIPDRGRKARCVVVVATGALLYFFGFPAPVFSQIPGAYRVDSQASRIEIHVFRTGVLGGLGDNHLIVLKSFSGTAEQPPGSAWQVHVIAESSSLRVLDPELSPSSRNEVQRTMLGPTQLEVARFPSIELQSRSFLPGENAQSWRMLADVSLHGVTRQVEFPLEWTQTGDELRVRGKKELRLKDFGIQPIRKFLGTLQVRNEFEFVYDIVLRGTATAQSPG